MVNFNDPNLQNSQNAAGVQAALEAASGISFATFPGLSLLDSDLSIATNRLNPLAITDIQSGICSKLSDVIPSACTMQQLTGLRTIIDGASSGIGSISTTIGGSATDNATAVLQRAQVVGLKSTAFDSTFQQVTGAAATGVLVNDISLYGAQASIASTFTNLLSDIGRVFFSANPTTWVLQSYQAPLIQGNVTQLYADQVAANASAYTAGTGILATLGITPTATNSNPTTIFNEVSKMASATKGLLTAIHQNATLYPRNKIADLVLKGNVNLAQIVAYEGPLLLIQSSCSAYIKGMNGVTATTEQTNLLNACTALNGVTTNTVSVVKNVCDKVYYYTGTGTFLVPTNSVTFSGATSGVVQLILAGCTMLNGVPNADGTGAVALTYSTVGYAGAIGGVYGYPNYFVPAVMGPVVDAISSSDFPWV